MLFDLIKFVIVSKFLKIDGLNSLDSFKRVLIFKHSTSCPVSSKAHREVERFMVDDPKETPIILIDVLKERALSMKISEHLDLRHESPQVIFLEKGKLLWNDSHFGVTSSKISKAIEV